MANSVPTLKNTNDMPANETRGRRKIDPSEWPNLLARREQGATQAEIAREYGVSQGTVSQILKRAREDWKASAPAASESGPANDDAGTGAAPAPATAASGAETTDARATLTVSGDGAFPATREAPAASEPAAAPAPRAEGAAPTMGAAPANATPDGGASAGPSAAVDDNLARTSAPAASGDARPRATPQRRVLTTARARPETPAASGGAPTASVRAPAASGGAPAASAESRESPASGSQAGAEGSPGDGGADLAESGNPLADRLRRAAADAAKLVDAQTAAGDQLGQAVHEVRRALAAIEIDAAKRQSAVTRASQPEPEIDDNEQFGRIKFFKPEKGFGFIIPDDGGDDVFLSSKTASAAGLDNLTQGDRVRFVPGPGSKGLEAKSIERDD